MTRNNIYYIYKTTDSNEDKEMFPEFHRSKVSDIPSSTDAVVEGKLVKDRKPNSNVQEK